MILCFDVGNTQIHGGFYTNNCFAPTFRLNSKMGWSADQFGVFLHTFCAIHKIHIEEVQGVAISSVVPSIDYHLKNASIKYFNQQPFFIKAGIKTGLSIKYRSSHEIGADLICGAAGAISLFPDEAIIVIDMGTATTITAISAQKEFLTGLIMPGIQTQVTALASSAEKLFSVDLVTPESLLARNTAESMQAGIYHLQLGGLQWIVKKLSSEAFRNQIHKVIATGGFARLFQNERFIDYFDSDLVLRGLATIYNQNLS